MTEDLIVCEDGLARPRWAASNGMLRAYYDAEWGMPITTEAGLFERLSLECFQSGLSWAIILSKREAFRQAFEYFDPEKVALFTEDDFNRLMEDAGIVRNRLKIASAISNARHYLEVQQRFGSFDAYLWQFVDGKPIINAWREASEVPAKTAISDKLSRDLQQRGFKFVGSTICYALMQAVGMVNDHTVDCFRHAELA